MFNLITGYGPVVGEALVSHPDVDMVSFTGSTRAGTRVSELASAGVKRVALELSGKSAAIILDDADFAIAVKGVVGNCFLNSGQTCTAHTRMLVPESRYEEAARLAVDAARTYRPGDPLAPETTLGPLASKMQLDRVRAYIDQGVAEGAQLLAGGAALPEGVNPGGYYVAPTVFGRVRWDASIAQVDINGGPFNMYAPFGGYKQSGNGRELGKYGLEEFLEYKAMQFKPAPKG